MIALNVRHPAERVLLSRLVLVHNRPAYDHQERDACKKAELALEDKSPCLTFQLEFLIWLAILKLFHMYCVIHHVISNVHSFELFLICELITRCSVHRLPNISKMWWEAFRCYLLSHVPGRCTNKLPRRFKYPSLRSNNPRGKVYDQWLKLWSAKNGFQCSDSNIRQTVSTHLFKIEYSINCVLWCFWIRLFKKMRFLSNVLKTECSINRAFRMY